VELTAADQKSHARSQRRQPEFWSETTENSRAGKFNSTFNHCGTRDNKFKSEPNRKKEKREGGGESDSSYNETK